MTRAHTGRSHTIVELLREHPERIWTTQELADATHSEVNATAALLSQLVDHGPVARVDRNQYRYLSY